MLDLLNTIISFFNSSIQHLLEIITAIPTYVGYFFTVVNSYIPSFALPFITLAVIAIVFIHIKRLII